MDATDGLCDLFWATGAPLGEESIGHSSSDAVDIITTWSRDFDKFSFDQF